MYFLYFKLMIKMIDVIGNEQTFKSDTQLDKNIESIISVTKLKPIQLKTDAKTII